MLLFAYIGWRIGTFSNESLTYAIGLILITLFFGIIYRENRFLYKEIIKTIGSRLPGRFINDPEELKNELVTTVNNAKEFIYCTGGRSKIEEYLGAIEQGVFNKKIEYYRVIMGNKITHELHQHLLKVMDQDKVRVRIIPEERFAFILVTEREVVLPLADPRPGIFQYALKIKSRNFAKKYKEYFLKLYSEECARILYKKELPSLCELCRKNTLI
jgi:hypothetical protein